MTRSTLARVSVCVFACGIISLGIQHLAETKAREAREHSHQLAEQLAQLEQESSWLSNRIARAKPPASLTGGQFRELLNLRGEVGQLRGDRRETDRLRATNQQIVAKLAKPDGAPPVQVRWKRDELAYAGYADPESAIITTLWGLNNGDPDFYLSMLTPGQKALADKEGQHEQLAGYYKKLGEMLNPPDATGISMVGKKLSSPDEAVVDIYYEGEGRTRKFVLRRMEGEWKLQDLALIVAN